VWCQNAGKCASDAEADEATFDRADVSQDICYKDLVAKGKCILWALGAMERHTGTWATYQLGFDTPESFALCEACAWPALGRFAKSIGPDCAEVPPQPEDRFAH
jgi:hypothetical protein